MKKLFQDKINTIFFAIYLIVIWAIYVFVNYYKELKNDKFQICCLMLPFLIIIICFSNWLMSVLAKVSFVQISKIGKRKKGITFIIYLFLSLLILEIWYLAYYPGGFSNDSIVQYKQVLAGTYNDWHPVWHTFLFFTIPVALTQNINLIVPIQIIYFSLVIGYMAMTIYEFMGMRMAVISWAYIFLNPYTGSILMYPWKDVAFATTALWVMVCVVRNYCLDGNWTDERGRLFLLAILLGNATLFRHNAILFTGPMLIAFCFYLNRRKWIYFIAVFLSFLVIVKGPLYSLAGVAEPDRRHLETMGLPLTIIANVTKEKPQALDGETASFVYSIATQEEWEEWYVCGSFNSIKWKDIDTSIVEEAEVMEILAMVLKCFKSAPYYSFQALFSLTDMVYAVEGDVKGDFKPDVINNDVGIVYQGNEKLAALLQTYKKAYTASVFRYTRYIGMTMLIMLAFMLAKSKLGKRRDWKRLFLCFPIFIYNFGTMLLLTGPDSRFFFLSFLVCPLVVSIMLFQQEERGFE